MLSLVHPFISTLEANPLASLFKNVAKKKKKTSKKKPEKYYLAAKKIFFKEIQLCVPG